MENEYRGEGAGCGLQRQDQTDALRTDVLLRRGLQDEAEGRADQTEDDQRDQFFRRQGGWDRLFGDEHADRAEQGDDSQLHDGQGIDVMILGELFDCNDLPGTKKSGAQTDGVAEIEPEFRAARHRDQINADDTEQHAEAGFFGEPDTKKNEIDDWHADNAEGREKGGARGGRVLDAERCADIAAEHQQTDAEGSLEQLWRDAAQMLPKEQRQGSGGDRKAHRLNIQRRQRIRIAKSQKSETPTNADDDEP